jgi:phenylpropionate dioxygenase-like ring-hydroxylating dioxygenase large terminal subunit
VEYSKSLIERDGKLRENWYVLCLSSELKKKPLSRQIYDKHYVVFRDSKKQARVLLDRCLHRHTLLSMGGEVRGDHIVCPYHGWEYDGEGKVKNIPSEGDELLKNRNYCLKGLKAVEQDGAIWVWTGDQTPDSERPPWRFPHFDNKNWYHYFMITDFDNEVTNLAENFMDVPHTVFVHKGWFRDPEDQKIPMTVETKNGRVLVTYDQVDDKLSPVARWILNPKGKPMFHTDCFIFPNITRVDYLFGKNGFIINSQITPISTLKSRVYTYISYSLGKVKNQLFAPIIRFYTRQVINQDVDIMHNQSISLKRDPICRFHSTPADEVHLGIERLRHTGIKNSEKINTIKTSKEVEFWV